ncbi:MAG: hypothetical protein ABI972_11170 [Acidobacteriota bacterium]
MKQVQGSCSGTLCVETSEQFGIVRMLNWTFHVKGSAQVLHGRGHGSSSAGMLVLTQESGAEWARLLQCEPHEMRKGVSYTLQTPISQDVATLVENTAEHSYRFAA